MAFADVKPIDGMSAGRILSLKTVIIGNLLTLTPLLLMLAGLGLAGRRAIWPLGRTCRKAESICLTPSRAAC